MSFRLKIPKAKEKDIFEEQSPFVVLPTKVADTHSAGKRSETTRNSESNFFFYNFIKVDRLPQNALFEYANFVHVFRLFCHFNYLADLENTIVAQNTVASLVKEEMKNYRAAADIDFELFIENVNEHLLKEDMQAITRSTDLPDLFFLFFNALHNDFTGTPSNLVSDKSCKFNCISHRHYFIDIQRTLNCQNCPKSAVFSSFHNYFFRLPVNKNILTFKEDIIEGLCLFSLFKKSISLCPCGSSAFCFNLLNDPSGILFELSNSLEQNRLVNGLVIAALRGKLESSLLFSSSKNSVYFLKGIIAKNRRYVSVIRQENYFVYVTDESEKKLETLQEVCECLAMDNMTPLLVFYEKMDELRASYYDACFKINNKKKILEISEISENYKEKQVRKEFSALEVKKRMMSKNNRCFGCGVAVEEGKMNCKREKVTRVHFKKREFVQNEDSKFENESVTLAIFIRLLLEDRVKF